MSHVHETCRSSSISSQCDIYVVAAEMCALFRSMDVRARIADFTDRSNNNTSSSGSGMSMSMSMSSSGGMPTAGAKVVHWAVKYFSRNWRGDCDDGDDDGERRGRHRRQRDHRPPPLILQDNAHSRLIIGTHCLTVTVNMLMMM